MKYLNGLQMEDQIIKQFGMSASTNAQNINDDIDAFQDGQSISIKTQHTAARTGNLAFEFMNMNDKTGDTRDSWLLTGKADLYWFIIENEAFVFEANDIKKFINKNKKRLRTTSLTSKSCIDSNNGRYWNQAKCYLVDIKSIMHLCIAEWLV